MLSLLPLFFLPLFSPRFRPEFWGGIWGAHLREISDIITSSYLLNSKLSFNSCGCVRPVCPFQNLLCPRRVSFPRLSKFRFPCPPSVVRRFFHTIVPIRLHGLSSQLTEQLPRLFLFLFFKKQKTELKKTSKNHLSLSKIRFEKEPERSISSSKIKSKTVSFLFSFQTNFLDHLPLFPFQTPHASSGIHFFVASNIASNRRFFSLSFSGELIVLPFFFSFFKIEKRFGKTSQIRHFSSVRKNAENSPAAFIAQMIPSGRVSFLFLFRRLRIEKKV